MPREGFLNENEFRAYPFLTRVTPLANNWPAGDAPAPLVALPHEAIVDFGAIMGLDAAYVGDTDAIYLSAIRRTGDLFLYELRTTAPMAADECLVFTRNLTDPEFTIEWAESIPLDESPVTDGGYGESSTSSSSSMSIGVLTRGDCALEAKWEGYLVTGLFTELSLLLPSDGVLTFALGLWQVEPARTQSLLQSYLRSISLANFPRTHVTVPQCGESADSSRVALVNTTCMHGDLQFMEGYNAAIRQNDSANTIVIGGAVGGGAGQPCEEVKIVDDEQPPAGSPYLSGGPSCGDIIKTINGVSGRQIRLEVGPGFRTYVAPETPHTLTVSMELGNFARILPSLSFSEISLGDGGQET